MVKQDNDAQVQSLHERLARALLTVDTLRAEIKKREADLEKSGRSTITCVRGELD
ncbi:MAG: hypothetical protein NVSMB31_10260 [Vulcanimicrobiaceae bacterium]